MPDGTDHKEEFQVLSDALAAVSRLHLGCAFTLEIKPEPQAIPPSPTRDPLVHSASQA